MQKIFNRKIKIPLINSGSSDNQAFIVFFIFGIRFFSCHLKTSSTLYSNITAFQRSQIWVFFL